MPYEEEIFCGVNPPPGNYLFKKVVSLGQLIIANYGVCIYINMFLPLMTLIVWFMSGDARILKARSVPDWGTLDVRANTLLCVDADLNLHVVADLTMENAWGSCRLIGVASGLSIDDDTCLPHGTVVVPFYNEYDEYAGSLTYTIEIKLCSEA